MSLRFVFFPNIFWKKKIDIYLLISNPLLEFLSIHDVLLTYADAQTLRVYNFLESILQYTKINFTNIIQI